MLAGNPHSKRAAPSPGRLFLCTSEAAVRQNCAAMRQKMLSADAVQPYDEAIGTPKETIAT
jgi:hypothetical protein